VNLPLIVNPEAEADIAEAKAWYDAQRPGLGDDLLDRIREVMNLVQRQPLLHGKVFQDLRLVLVERFPYAVVYRIDDDQITVVAIFHTRRDPNHWKSRSLNL